MKALVTAIGVVFYTTLIGGFLLVFFTIYPVKGAEKYSDEEAGRYTCADVRWAKANLSEQDIAAIKQRMTKLQLLKATACLLKGSNETYRERDYYPIRDIAK